MAVVVRGSAGTGSVTCPRVAPTDDWQQVQLLPKWPEQVTWESIRPMVLFGRSPAQRATKSGAAERSV